MLNDSILEIISNKAFEFIKEDRKELLDILNTKGVNELEKKLQKDLEARFIKE